MGKGAILLVLASIYGWTMTVASKNQVYLDRQDEQAFYEEKVLARERALSGFDIVVAGTENDFKNFRPDGASQPYRDGSFTYTAIGQSGNTVHVQATGTVGRSEYSIIGDLVMNGSARLAALNFVGPVWSATGRGASYTITGVNTPPPSRGLLKAAGDFGNALGVYSTLEEAHVAVEEGLRPELVTGGETGEIGSWDWGMAKEMKVSDDGKQLDFDALSKEIRDLCQVEGPSCRILPGNQVFAGNEQFGSSDEPIIIIVNGNATLRGTVHGYGVLYVNGSFRTEVGEPIWEGLVYASTDGGQHELRGQPKVYGATILRSIKEDGATAPAMDFLVRGEPSFFYSTDALLMLNKLSPKLGFMVEPGTGKIELMNVRQASSSATSFDSMTQ